MSIQQQSRSGYHVISGEGQLSTYKAYKIKNHQQKTILKMKDYIPNIDIVEGYVFLKFYNNAIRKSKVIFHTEDIFNIRFSEGKRLVMKPTKEKTIYYPRTFSNTLLDISKSVKKDVRFHNMSITSPNNLEKYFDKEIPCKISSIDLCLTPEISNMESEDKTLQVNIMEYSQNILDHFYLLNKGYCDLLNVFFFQDKYVPDVHTLKFDTDENDHYNWSLHRRKYSNDLGHILDKMNLIKNSEYNETLDMREAMWMMLFQEFEAHYRNSIEREPMPECIALIKFQSLHPII